MVFKQRNFPYLISIDRIWDFALHNALTDLIRYRDLWFLTFRESDSHVDGKNGVIRILASEDSIIWRSAGLISMPDVDLRDPKLSVTADGHLMLNVAGNFFSPDGKYLYRQSLVAFSKDGILWNDLLPILHLDEWLWRVTWYHGKAYGVTYRLLDPFEPKTEWVTVLYKSDDGRNYQPLVQWEIPGKPNESTLRFSDSGMMVALVRREGEDLNAWLGVSLPPYTDWNWGSTNYFFGGPNFVMMPRGNMWASGRMTSKTPYGAISKTLLARLDLAGLHPTMVLPSGGDDTGYPGMVYHDKILYISYYSSHEGKAAIYLVKVQLPME